LIDSPLNTGPGISRCHVVGPHFTDFAFIGLAETMWSGSMRFANDLRRTPLHDSLNAMKSGCGTAKDRPSDKKIFEWPETIAGNFRSSSSIHDEYSFPAAGGSSQFHLHRSPRNPFSRRPSCAGSCAETKPLSL